MPDDRALAEVAADVRRIADRLRTFSAGQLAAAAPPYPSRAAAGRAAAQALAVAAQGIEQAADQAEPPWRLLPDLSDFAVGDQVAVTGQDLLAAAANVPADDEVWVLGDRRRAGTVVAEVAGLLTAVRRAL